MPANAHLKLVTPTAQNATVMPSRPANSELRTREHLLPGEIDKLLAATKLSRYPQRDATLILVAYHHGLRAKEAAELEWSQIDFETATLHVRRAKRGEPATHPIRGDEMRALRQLQREQVLIQREQVLKSPFVFTTERGTPFTPAALNRMIKRLGANTSIEFGVHFHMLRHACGYRLANDGHDTRSIQDYLGHKNIVHTARYTALAPTKFKDFGDKQNSGLEPDNWAGGRAIAGSAKPPKYTVEVRALAKSPGLFLCAWRTQGASVGALDWRAASIGWPGQRSRPSAGSRISRAEVARDEYCAQS